MDVMWQIVSVVGMLGLVVAYVRNRRGTWTQDGANYLWFNALGALLLTAYSVRIEQWVFVALEGFWSIEAFRGLWSLRTRPAP